MTPPSFDPVPDATLLRWGGDEADVEGRFARWLIEESTPEDWHRFVMDMNWDFTEGVLPWIVSRPRCDKGTALLVFWRAQPDFYLQCRGVRPVGLGDDGFDLLCMIRDRWEAGFYTGTEFAFDLANDIYDADQLTAAGMCDLDRLPDFDALRAEHGAFVDRWIPPGMRATLPGRRPDTAGLLDGIPLHLWPEEYQMARDRRTADEDGGPVQP